MQFSNEINERLGFELIAVTNTKELFIKSFRNASSTKSSDVKDVQKAHLC